VSFAYAAILCVTATQVPATESPITRTRTMMATQVTIAVAGSASEEAFEEAFAVFERIDQVMNEWRPGSVLSLINEAAGMPRRIPAPADLCEVLRLSLDGARRTNGLFDPTWAALKPIWRFGTDEPHDVPSNAQIKNLCPLVRFSNVELRMNPDKSCTVRLRRKGMKLGLGGVAKGYGVDEAVAVLRKHGLKNFYVQAGGDLYASGRNGDRPWRVGIRDPRGNPDTYFASLDVENAAFSTSGDYERFFVQDGQRYHHIIDPRTCRPAPKTRSVSVLASSAADAEFFSKAAFIAGGHDGLKRVEEAGAAAVMVTSANEVLVSGKIHEALTLNASPSP
jgi:thiamine biosynthesis lipoprotein